VSILTQLTLAIVPVVVVSGATAIYLNRRKSNMLYQRLFGLSDDPTDNGAMQDITVKVDSIDENVKDLNHNRIDDIEERLEDLRKSMETIETRLTEEERADE